MNLPVVMLVALGIDLAVGWPDGLFRRIGHPVTWIGRQILFLEGKLNRGTWPALKRRLAGVLVLVLVAGTAALLALMLERSLPAGTPAMLIAGITGWPLIAARSLHQHVRAIAVPLDAGDLAGARIEVSKIVGRDPDLLDAAGVSRAAIESLAENTSDGIVAPLFWGALLGLPGLAAYKAINTLDSMIGHRTERFSAFGWASARFDDLVNLVPARLTALLFALASSRPVAAIATAWRDADHHRSPNAGWPEAAMAGALGVRLSGPRAYEGAVSDEPWVNACKRDPAAADILAGLALYRRVILLLAVALGTLAFAVQ
ncbi:MAG: adenosylcobinamide-phosphate [Beijerinckiaceae bacterium]|nr:MAG: adenosylcobinamide-phosphate [Beijerinckiaceae bacterium]